MTSPTSHTPVIKIDVDSVLRQRLPERWQRMLPPGFASWLKRTICQDSLNELLEKTAGSYGSDFCYRILSELNVTYHTTGPQPSPSHRRVIVVCNHPLGALDGIAIIHWASRIWGDHIKFVVNDLLMAVKPLEPVFIPVNKHGRQNRDNTSELDRYLAGDDPLIIFPAGLVSRRGKHGIRDLKWQKSFVNHAIKYSRDIIPVYFDGCNSSFFYNFAKMRTLLGLKFNIEMIYLPREIFRSRNSDFGIVAGKLIRWQELRGGRQASATARDIKHRVYALKQQQTL